MFYKYVGLIFFPIYYINDTSTILHYILGGFLMFVQIILLIMLILLNGVFAASEIGQTMTAYINDSVMLEYLYENNPVMKLIENIL